MLIRRNNFGPKIPVKRQREALLHPQERAPAGHAGVYIKHYVKGGDYYKRCMDDYGYTNRLVRRPVHNYTAVSVVDETANRLDTRTIRNFRLLPSMLNERRALHAIAEAFKDAVSYGQEMGVPVDTQQTHADYSHACER